MTTRNCEDPGNPRAVHRSEYGRLSPDRAQGFPRCRSRRPTAVMVGMNGLRTAAFGRPAGMLGRLGGTLMTRTGAATELYVVECLAALRPTDSVLVVGPGPGIGLLAAAERTPLGSVAGVEPSAVMRRAAARRCAEPIRRGVVTVSDGTAARTGQRDDSIDVAIAVNNAQLWPDRLAAFAELHRVLRAGGRLVVSLPEHVMPNRREELRQEAVAAGFADARVTTRRRLDHPWGPAIDLIGHCPRTAAAPTRWAGRRTPRRIHKNPDTSAQGGAVFPL